MISETTAAEWNDKGIKFSQNNQQEKEMECYNKAIELDPNFSVAYHNRAQVYNALEQYEKAIEDYNKAIELDPNLPDAYNNRGVSYYNSKQYGKAIEDYDKAIELNPNDEKAYHNRALVYEALCQHEKAAEGFEIVKTLEQSTYTTWSEVFWGGIIAGIISGLFGFLGRGATIAVMALIYFFFIHTINPAERRYAVLIIMAILAATISSLVSHF
jgi:tetratricopeptide (TPR) repeat protein